MDERNKLEVRIAELESELERVRDGLSTLADEIRAYVGSARYEVEYRQIVDGALDSQPEGGEDE